MTRTLLAAALCALAAACGGAEPPNELLGRRANQPGAPGDPGVDPTSGDATDTDAGMASAAGSSSSGGTTDAGGGTAGNVPPANGFTGAAAYVAQNGPSTIKGDHGGDGNPAKRNCLDSSCHGAGGEGPRFLAGGTVFKDLAGTMPAAQVEVRIRDGAGGAVLARTDVNGNFFVKGSGVTFPAQTGARDGAVTKLMSSSIANGDCNSSSCHGGTQGWIHVP